MRRLTEAQYRNSIADIFGADIKVSGRFDPIVRPPHRLVAAGARSATISPAGMEQYDAMARAIAAQVFDDRHRPVFVACKPHDEALPDKACAETVLMRLGRYLFRRPLMEGERREYLQMAERASLQEHSFDAGLRLSLAAMLVSPNFLYVLETSEPDPNDPASERLDNYSRASRLSFLLWNTTPNETLLSAAARNQLTDDAQLRAIAARMAASPRVENAVRAFFSDMLVFEKFDDMSKDSIIYPRFNRDVAKALPEQMLRTIVDHLLVRDGDYRELFTTRRTFINRSLGPLYDVPVSASSGWVRYDVPEGDTRTGLLGQAGFLALYSHSGRSSATLRGRAIRELLMCEPVPDPPGNVNFTAVQDVNSKAFPTARMRLSQHATDAVCAGCHRITDPIGLSLENFDGIGAFRAKENGATIDVAGTMDGTDFEGLAGLGKSLAASPSTTSCVASRALEYATGVNVEEDTRLLESVEADFAREGYRFPALLLRIATLPELYRVKPAPLAPVPALSWQDRKRFRGGERQ